MRWVLCCALVVACSKDDGDTGPDADPLEGILGVPLSIPTDQGGNTETDIADPHVIRVGDTWYLYPTNKKTNLEVWSSTDLVTWTWEGVIWEPTPGTWNEAGEAWAPSVHPGEEPA